MKRLFLVALVMVVCGCTSFSRSAKDVPDSSDVAEVPDEVWNRVQKKIEERAKANAPKKNEQPDLDREKERMQIPDPGRTSGAAGKRK